MADIRKPNYSEIDALKGKLISLESRLARIESELGIASPANYYTKTERKDTKTDADMILDHAGEEESFLESRIGEYGLAWIGNIVLLFGITFLTGYLQIFNRPGISALAGYLCVAIILMISGRVRKSLLHLGSIMKLNGHLLLFYITLRLHFFTTTPLIQSKTLSFILLVILIIIQAYIAIRSNSQLFYGLVLTLALIAALVSDSTHLMLPMLTLVAAGSTYLMFRLSWKGTLVYSIILVYTCMLLWFLNNPVMGNPMGAIDSQNGGIFYLFAIGAAYTQIALLRQRDGDFGEFAMTVIILSGLSFTTMLTLIILQFFSSSYMGILTVITVCCLSYSVILKRFSEWKFTSALYALYGFSAMSISLYGLLGLPDVFLSLAVQSLLVVSVALWFRNKIIVYLNALLLVFLIVVYFAVSEPVNGVNLSFALVTIITARVLNWKKKRLEIETETLRNFYLIAGFVLVLYALFHWMPRQFVTLSWSTAAIIYFGLSILLKNPKYRLMALGTIISTAFYLFIVDLAKIELFYRVIAFLFLSIISITVSVYYTRHKRST
ncbi:MAG TPA: hypothetical protein VMW76_02845 [Bacteroidales bacterium]|nr:hypothetical protein [Bacteroidales bacterium]